MILLYSILSELSILIPTLCYNFCEVMIMSSQRPLKDKVSITLDSDVIQAIKELSEQDDRPFSQYVNRVLRKHLISVGYFSENKTKKPDSRQP